MDLSGLVNKNKNKVFSLAVIILALIIAFNIYKGQAGRAYSLKAQISEESKKSGILAGIAKLQEQIDSYRKLFIKKEASSLISDINNIAQEAGVNIISIKPSGEAVFPEYTKYIFNLSVIAPDYDKLAEFINKLEVYENVYIVDALDIQAPSYNKNKELKADLRVSAVAMIE